MFKPKLPPQDQGFTLVEVLVSILIATVFVTTALQAMVVAALIKAKAQAFSEATTWIQQDLENVRHTASELQYTSLTTATTAGATVLQVTSVVGFQLGNTVLVGLEPTSRTIASINANPTPKTITLSAGLPAPGQPVGAVVAATNKCNAASQGTGFADYLRTNLPSMSNDPAVVPNPLKTNEGTKRIAGQMYILTRYGPDADDPNPSIAAIDKTRPNIRDTAFEVMEMKYEVKEVKPAGGYYPAIATLYTEVIPNAAFKCP